MVNSEGGRWGCHVEFSSGDRTECVIKEAFSKQKKKGKIGGCSCGPRRWERGRRRPLPFFAGRPRWAISHFPFSSFPIIFLLQSNPLISLAFFPLLLLIYPFYPPIKRPIFLLSLSLSLSPIYILPSLSLSLFISLLFHPETVIFRRFFVMGFSWGAGFLFYLWVFLDLFLFYFFTQLCWLWFDCLFFCCLIVFIACKLFVGLFLVIKLMIIIIYKFPCVRWGNLFAVIAHRIWMIDLCFICPFSYFLYLIWRLWLGGFYLI